MKNIIFLLLSPTLLWASSQMKKKENDPDGLRLLIIQKNWQYFIVAPILAVALFFLSRESWQGWHADLQIGLIVASAWYAFSRVNEVFVAFLKDAVSHLQPKKHASSLKYYERIPLAAKSYLELIILYGVLAFILHYFYQTLSCGASDPSCCDITVWQTIYYSGVTITTLGYGDISPIDWSAQLLAIYEVINGFSLIVVSFTVYVSRSIAAGEYVIPGTSKEEGNGV